MNYFCFIKLKFKHTFIKLYQLWIKNTSIYMITFYNICHSKKQYKIFIKSYKVIDSEGRIVAVFTTGLNTIENIN